MSEQSKMNQVIEKYLSRQDFEHALLLNGRWGCGKTYFVKKLQEKNKNIFYFSLNGFDDISIVEKSLFFFMLTGKFKLGKKQNKIFTELASLLKKFDKGNPNMFLSFLDSGCNIFINLYGEKCFEQKYGGCPILILDDLDRISDKIEITDLLGTIHTKFVLNGVKVIYVADEQKIENQDKYTAEREKYIFRTINFKRNNKDIYNSFLQKKEMSDTFLDILLAVFSDAQDNLRTVQFCLDCYQELADSYKNQNLYENCNSPKMLFYSICMLSKFYKAGFSDKEKLLSAVSTYFIDSHLNEKSSDEYKQFVSKVNSANFYYCYLDSFIVEFIYDGFLDENALVEFLRKPTEDAINKLSTLDNLETSELKDSLNEVKENLENEIYTIRQYAILRQTFIPYAEELGICSKDEAMELIERSIFSDKEENKTVLVEQFEYWQKDSYSLIKNAKNGIEKRILKEFDEYKWQQEINKTEEFYQKLVKLDSSIFGFDSERKDLFTRLVNNDYADKLFSMKNKSINMLNSYINSAICNLSNANEWYSAEIPVLETLETGITEKINSINNDPNEVDFMKSNALSALKDTISLAIQHIKGSI